MNSPYKKILPLLVVFTVLLSSNFIDAAWTAPSGIPTAANNASAPINVSATDQDKSGGIIAGNLRSDDLVIADGQMWSAEYCDAAGVNCFTPVMCADGQVMVANSGSWICADNQGGTNSTTTTSAPTYRTYVLSEAQMKQVALSDFTADTGGGYNPWGSGFYARGATTGSRVCELFGLTKGSGTTRVVSQTNRAYSSPDNNFTDIFDGTSWSTVNANTCLPGQSTTQCTINSQGDQLCSTYCNESYNVLLSTLTCEVLE